MSLEILKSWYPRCKVQGCPAEGTECFMASLWTSRLRRASPLEKAYFKSRSCHLNTGAEWGRKGLIIEETRQQGWVWSAMQVETGVWGGMLLKPQDHVCWSWPYLSSLKSSGDLVKLEGWVWVSSKSLTLLQVTYFLLLFIFFFWSGIIPWQPSTGYGVNFLVNYPYAFNNQSWDACPPGRAQGRVLLGEFRLFHFMSFASIRADHCFS